MRRSSMARESLSKLTLAMCFIPTTNQTGCGQPFNPPKLRAIWRSRSNKQCYLRLSNLLRTRFTRIGISSFLLCFSCKRQECQNDLRNMNRLIAYQIYPPFICFHIIYQRMGNKIHQESKNKSDRTLKFHTDGDWKHNHE